MYKLGSQYVYENPTNGEVLSAGERRNYAMMYSDNESILILRDSKGVKVEAKLRIL